MKKVYRLEWQDWQKRECACYIQIFEGRGTMDGRAIVIATNSAASGCVTIEAESVAARICRKESIHHERLAFIEHCERNERFDETFDQIQFAWNEREKRFENPVWIHLTEEYVRQITGDFYKKAR